MKKIPAKNSYDFYIKSDTSAYHGEWIAFTKSGVVSHGLDAQKVYNQALRRTKTADVALAKVPEEQILVLKLSK